MKLQMKVLYAGSPAIAIPALEAISAYCVRHEDKGIELAGVLTNPDSPKGRLNVPQPTEVGEAAAVMSQSLKEQGRAAFPVFKPQKLDAPFREQTAALKPDLLVCFAYGRIFGPKFLSVFPLGGINIHPSLLPKYRGPSPIQAAILNRDCLTGISVQKLAPEVDSGDILAQEQIQLTGKETTGSLSEIMARKASDIMPALLEKISGGTIQSTPQNHDEASYCSPLTKEDGIINWNKSASEIEAMIRAFDPWPLCRTFHKGRELLILKAAAIDNGIGKPGVVLGIDKKDGILIQTGKGILAVTELQYQQKKALFWVDFINGARDFTGSQLG